MTRVIAAATTGILLAVFMAVARPSSCDEFVRIMRTGKVGKCVTVLFSIVLAGTAAVLVGLPILVLSQ